MPCGCGVLPVGDDVTDEQGLAAAEPVDPDIGVVPAATHFVLLAVMLGGIVGAVARYESGLWFPTRSDAFPWTTLSINLIGSFLLSIVVVAATDVWPRQGLIRPLLGTGVIGGFTTFSTFAVDQQRLLTNGHALTSIAYLALTLVGCLAASWVAAEMARRLVVSVRR
jgi:fluoride exporter